MTSCFSHSQAETGMILSMITSSHHTETLGTVTRIFSILKEKKCRWPLEGDEHFLTSDVTETNPGAPELALVPAGLKHLEIVRCAYIHISAQVCKCKLFQCHKDLDEAVRNTLDYPVSWKRCWCPHDMLYSLFLSWFHTQTLLLRLGKH